MKYQKPKFNGWCGILYEGGAIYAKTKKDLSRQAKIRNTYLRSSYPISDFEG